MSYILEALRKSEHERRQGQPVAGYEPVPMMPSRRSQGRWPFWLGLVLLLNAVVLVYVLWSGQQSGEPAASPVVAETVSQPAPAPTRTAPAPEPEPAPVVTERVTERVPEPPPEPVAATPARTAPAPEARPQEPPEPPSAVAENTADEVPLLSELPQSFQRRVPDLVFNSHIYSSSPASRRVMINQRNLGEGDRLNNLMVETITPAGVILRLDGQSFEIAVVRNWTQPR